MQSQNLHARAIIFDGHNDSLMLRLERQGTIDLGPADDTYHVDLPRLRQSGTTALNTYIGARDLHVSLKLWNALYWHLERYPEALLLAETAGDIRAAKVAGRVALVAQLESCACLGESAEVLQMQQRLGLRVANLTHGEGQDRVATALQVDSSMFGYTSAGAREFARRQLRGLTDFGRETVHACNELRVVIDLAHANDRTFYDALQISAQPCIFSHGCVFARCNHWRGLTDDQIRLLAEHGGLLCVAFYGNFIHPEEPSMERLLDQVAHVVDLVGPDHIGFGSDFDGLPPKAKVIPLHQGRLIEFTEGLARRFSEEIVLKVLGGNLLRVFERVCG